MSCPLLQRSSFGCAEALHAGSGAEGACSAGSVSWLGSHQMANSVALGGCVHKLTLVC